MPPPVPVSPEINPITPPVATAGSLGISEFLDSTNGVSGNRHTNSIMSNVLYDFTTGWPITPHIGVGIGAMNVFDGLKVPGRGLVFNDSSWQFGYQAIAGLRLEINPLLALDLDYRYLATTESTFRIPNTGLHYRTGANTWPIRGPSRFHGG